jgi:threonine dehydratase
MIDEVVAEGIEKPDLVIASVGGGGLACGVLEGMKAVLHYLWFIITIRLFIQQNLFL